VRTPGKILATPLGHPVRGGEGTCSSNPVEVQEFRLVDVS